MADCTVSSFAAATPELQEVVTLLTPQLMELALLVHGFRSQSPTAERTDAFEKNLAATLRESGLSIVAQEYNRVEPKELVECPLRVRLAGQEYRRRPKSRNRIATLFGEMDLWRYWYEAVDEGEPSLFPLELHLGIEAGLATPAVAERVGLGSAEHEQAQVLAWLREEHGVSWSVTSLRKVTAALRDGLASFREEAQVARVLEMLQRAFDATGRHRPVLVAGRDGVHVPLRQDGYHEAATMTLSVMDRRGKRVGTVYLGQMPEPGQETASTNLTELLTKVLAPWHAQGRPAPRLT